MHRENRPSKLAWNLSYARTAIHRRAVRFMYIWHDESVSFGARASLPIVSFRSVEREELAKKPWGSCFLIDLFPCAHCTPSSFYKYQRQWWTSSIQNVHRKATIRNIISISINNSHKCRYWPYFRQILTTFHIISNVWRSLIAVTRQFRYWIPFLVARLAWNWHISEFVLFLQGFLRLTTAVKRMAQIIKIFKVVCKLDAE